MLKRSTLLIACTSSLWITGCGGTVTPTATSDASTSDTATTPDGGSTTPDTGSTDSTSVSDSTAPHDSTPTDSTAPHDAGPMDAGPAGTVTGELSIGPLHLNPGDERTVCVVLPLAAARDFVATNITMNLAPGSHHAIAYRSTDTTPSPTLSDCQPLGGVTGGTAPMLIAQHDGDALELPSGIGLPIAATQMIKLELHGINTTHAALDVTATVHLSGPDAAHATSLQSADLAFWGTMNIAIPAHSTYSTGIQFQPGISGTHGFAVTTHQHSLGTDFKVWKSANGTDVTETSPTIVDNADWANPKTFYFSPTIDFTGTEGLAYECQWNNPTSSEVDFGESALNEMCFLWMYYYPAKGFDVCLSTPCPR
ncbi:MAG: hypothetical protein ACHREM_20285 [Polyangiales bacterium]